MNMNWQTLTKLAAGDEIIVTKVKLKGSGISIEGSFELPALARLSEDDQVFISAFLQCHGSIKQMESLFGISYPTVKSRLNRIAGGVDFVTSKRPNRKSIILNRVSAGEISVEEAIKLLNDNDGEL